MQHHQKYATTTEESLPQPEVCNEMIHNYNVLITVLNTSNGAENGVCRSEQKCKTAEYQRKVGAGLLFSDPRSWPPFPQFLRARIKYNGMLQCL